MTALQDTSGQQWKGSGREGLQWAAAGSHRSGGRHSNYVPTLEQRFRVFENLGTLTGYHTRQVGPGMDRWEARSSSLTRVACASVPSRIVHHQLAIILQTTSVRTIRTLDRLRTYSCPAILLQPTHARFPHPRQLNRWNPSNPSIETIHSISLSATTRPRRQTT